MKKLYALILMLHAFALHAQTNLDFETGDFTGWNRFTALVDTNVLAPCLNKTYILTPVIVNDSAAVALVNSQHTSITCNNSIPVGQGQFSALLNGYGWYSSTAGIEQSFTVTNSNSIIHYAFAGEFEIASHLPNEQSFFRAEITDQNDNPYRQKVYHPFMQNSILSSCFNPISEYCNWIADTIDLSAYIGMTVRLAFIGSNCVFQGHRGFAYVDVSAVNTGIAESVGLPGITITNNPSTDGLFGLNKSNPEACEYSLYNLTGQLLKNGSCNGQTNIISIVEQPPGLYFLEVKSAGKYKKGFKIIRL